MFWIIWKWSFSKIPQKRSTHCCLIAVICTEEPEQQEAAGHADLRRDQEQKQEAHYQAGGGQGK